MCPFAQGAKEDKTKQIYICTYIQVGYRFLPIASSYSSDYLSSVCSHLFRFGEEFLFGEVVEVLDCRLNQLVEREIKSSVGRCCQIEVFYLHFEKVFNKWHLLISN